MSTIVQPLAALNPASVGFPPFASAAPVQMGGADEFLIASPVSSPAVDGGGGAPHGGGDGTRPGELSRAYRAVLEGRQGVRYEALHMAARLGRLGEDRYRLIESPPLSREHHESCWRIAAAFAAERGDRPGGYAGRVQGLIARSDSRGRLLLRKLQGLDATCQPLSVALPNYWLLRELHDAWNFTRGLDRGLFDTRIYFYPNYPYLKGYPEIARDAKAAVIAFGGSGTVKATGRNFMGIANSLHRYGISLLSFDYPFHASGPRGEGYMGYGRSMAMFMKLVGHYRSNGLPVFLIGHSMGPSIIQEILRLSPKAADGAIYFSPAGSASADLYDRYRAQLASGALDVIGGRPVEIDPVGTRWEELMDKALLSRQAKRMDAEVPVWIVAGELDPFSTPEMVRDLAARYRNARAEVIKGVGHNVFDIREANKVRLMVNRIVELVSSTTGILLSRAPAQYHYRAKAFTYKRSMHPFSAVLYLHHNSRLFRQWYGNVEYGRPIEVFLSDERAALDLFYRWTFWLENALVEYARICLNDFRRMPVDKDLLGRLESLARKRDFDEADVPAVLAAIRNIVEGLQGRS